MTVLVNRSPTVLGRNACLIIVLKEFGIIDARPGVAKVTRRSNKGAGVAYLEIFPHSRLRSFTAVLFINRKGLLSYRERLFLSLPLCKVGEGRTNVCTTVLDDSERHFLP